MSELQPTVLNREVTPILQICCSRRLHAVVASPYSGAAITGNFAQLLNSAIKFEIRGKSGFEFDKLSPAVVSFILNDVLYVFVGSTMAFVPALDKGSLVVTLPPFILQPDLRRYFRVPLINPDQLNVQLENHGYTILKPNIIDLSSGGMLIEFDDDPQLDAKTGHPVRLQMDDHTAEFIAEIRHNNAGKYGLMFIGTLNTADPSQAKDALENILARLKDQWLESDCLTEN